VKGDRCPQAPVLAVQGRASWLGSGTLALTARTPRTRGWPLTSIGFRVVLLIMSLFELPFPHVMATAGGHKWRKLRSGDWPRAEGF
jgi:hypothetical protein